MNSFSKLAILVGVVVCLAAATRAEAARIYNKTGRSMKVYQIDGRLALALTGGRFGNPTNDRLIVVIANAEVALDSADWTEENGTRSPSIMWDDPCGPRPKGVIISVPGQRGDGAQFLTVLCPNSDDDFRGDNYLIVTLEDGYLVAKMYDSNKDELWTHTTKKD